MPEPTPEAWAQIRHDYEHTDRQIVDICFEHGITSPMLRYRVKVWNWQRRKPFVPRNGPPPVVVQNEIAAQDHPTPPAFAHASAGDPSPPEPAPGRAQARPGWEGEETAIVPRLQSAVARVLPAIESTIARLASGAHHPREMEQAGRTLSSLTRTLRELNGLLSEHNARPGDACTCDCHDDMPEDIDEFRNALARRIDALFASEMAEEEVQD